VLGQASSDDDSKCDHHPTQGTICVVTYPLELPERWIRRAHHSSYHLRQKLEGMCAHPNRTRCWHRRQRVHPQRLGPWHATASEPTRDINRCHTHRMEIHSERSLDTLSTEASTEWRYDSSGHPSLEISTKDAVVAVASHRGSPFAEGHQRRFIMARFVRNACTQKKKREKFGSNADKVFDSNRLAHELLVGVKMVLILF
jgi:hypothetical protein